ncbi:Transcriptional regulator, contains XRE-family HTH domain [Streptomyces zhaozhouensis]|uniref:Transcriptional regulator, contains XRE-family HTH domain n=1 Tax=Streptomyces zhaozhouensis TaxID=1300267 RepID=A0A286E702_9ACTN|nr:helix-turn-helix transcriptional regulator [Streptomyces zhaozhouensis]SOD66634.1 Transcriptional regulator, contains XRE-family HTH domain [Streptomyces zhaozhouensis]
MDRGSELSDFLRTRRARVTPDAAGLPPDPRPRRVPGLRRDEVARLAGVSSEYYTRLEQGRARNPSPEVVEALAAALRLDHSEREHLGNLLARPRPAARRAPASPQRVRPGLRMTLEALERVPAFVIGRRTEVLATNRLAREVMTDFDALPVKQRSIARFILLNPEARHRLVDWEQGAAETVAMLRLEAGRSPHDRQLTDLVGELMVRSPEFGRWWHDHRVLSRTHGLKRYRHPLVGELDFHYESFPVPGDPEQVLCVYNVEPDSETARAIGILGGWTAPPPPTTPARADHRADGPSAD